MIAIATSHIESVIQNFQAEIADQQIILFAELSNWCLSLTDPDELAYVTKLAEFADELITAQPLRLQFFKAELEKILAKEVIRSKKKKRFRSKILEVLDYSGRRSDFYPKYFHQVGIKACVYCNSMLTVSVEQMLVSTAAKKVYRAKFQVDHFSPKNENPGLSISLYNLYPVCANCNLIKGIRKVDFDLYRDQVKQTSPFTFKLAAGSKGQYTISRDIDDILIEFEEPKKKKGYHLYNDLFDIKGIYDTQLDIAEELILKAEAYTEAYKDSLETSLPKVFKDRKITNRLLIGNYVDTADTHKRPLAKFTRDIAISIGLLPPDSP